MILNASAANGSASSASRIGLAVLAALDRLEARRPAGRPAGDGR